MRICIPIKAKSVGQAEKLIKAAGRHADFVEIWCDVFSPAEIARLIKKSHKPVIAVCRGKVEHGSFSGSERDRISLLKAAVINGAKFVDIGTQTSAALINEVKKACKKNGAKMIISAHTWKNTPTFPKLLAICARAQKLGADIVKVATYTKYWSDNVVLFELTKHITEKGGKIIAIGMGEKGKISRVACPILGSFLTYVALNNKLRTAPGQLVWKKFGLEA